MIDGNLALIIEEPPIFRLVQNNSLIDVVWSQDDHSNILQTLQQHGCQYLKGREEYTLLKEVVSPNLTQESNLRHIENTRNPVKPTTNPSGVISPLCCAIQENNTDTNKNRKPFLAPLDKQKAESIADIIPSFKVIQSNSMSLNIGFDTEFQDYRDGSDKNRRVLSLQMTIAVGETLIRYFFLVDPRFQEVTADGGQIPLKYCLADILEDLKKHYFPDFPLIRK